MHVIDFQYDTNKIARAIIMINNQCRHSVGLIANCNLIFFFFLQFEIAEYTILAQLIGFVDQRTPVYKSMSLDAAISSSRLVTELGN
jgi:hypothetical protein